VQCSTLTATRLEEELALDRTSSAAGPATPRGRLALAHGSTLYLDDVADLPLDAQAILGQVLWGDGAHIAMPRAHVDARVVAGTSRNLMRGVSDGTVRDDFYARLGALPIRVPTLRERLEDVPLLAWHFVDEFSELYRKAIDTIDAQSMTALQEYEWPGNIRELRNVIERAMIVGTGRHLHIPLPAGRRGGDATLAAVEKAHIVSVLTACDWRIEGEDGAASRLGLTPQQLHTRMRRLGIQQPRR
jgi:transcriptional regulator with GAF, ATPase, and Fis domain